MFRILAVACALQAVLISNALSQTIVWEEDFALPNGTTEDNTPPSEWNIDDSGADLSAGNSYFEVRGGEMAARNVHGVVLWNSEVIDVSSATDFMVSMEISESGNLEPTDYLTAYYILDGGTPVIFGHQSEDIDGGGPILFSISNLNANTLQIRVEIGLETGNNELFNFDNVVVRLPAVIYSRGNGNWNSSATWSFTQGGASCSCTPNYALSPIIQNGHTVSINVAAQASFVTVQSGGILRWVNGGSNLSVGNNGSITVDSGGRINRNGSNNAIIDIASGTNYTITSNDNTNGVTLQDLLISGSGINVVLSGTGFINLNRDFVNSGTGNTITKSVASMQISGLLEMNTGDGNTFTNSGILTIGSDLLFDSSSNIFINNGTLAINDDIRVRVSGLMNNSFTNNVGAIVSFNQLQANNSPGFSFTNSGIVNMSGQFVNGDFPANNTIINQANATWNYGGNTFDPDLKLFTESPGNTFNYNRGGNQNIVPSQAGYANLTISGTGNKSSSAQLNVLGNLNVSSTLALANDDLNLGGNLSNTGTISNGSNTINLNGANQSINSGGSSFNNLTVGGTMSKTLAANIDVNGNLLINSTLSVGTNFQINLAGNWTNNGIFLPATGNLVFDGSGNQSMLGTSTTSLNNLLINKSGGILMNEGSANLNGTLTIQSTSQFDADGSGSGIFTLVSTVFGTARIATLPAGSSVTGNLTAQRYIPANTKHWYHLSSPVLNATVSDLQNEILISGTFTGNNNGVGSIPGNALPSMYYYNESASGNLSQGYVVYPVSSNAELLTQTANSTQARGYYVWIREVESGAVTANLRGTINQGNVNFNVTYTDDPGQPSSEDGWNLVGNPYPSSIDWDNPGWTKSGIQGNTIYIWDGSSYQMWNGTSGRAEQGRIAMSQGFWVQANSVSTSLIASESVKTATTASYFRTTEIAPSAFALELSGSANSDATYFEFDSEGLSLFDEFDARKLENSEMDFYSMSSNQVRTGINVLPLDFCTLWIPLEIEKAKEGNYIIRFSEVNTEGLSKIILHDNYLGKTVNLIDQPEYSFNISKQKKTYSGRFQLELTHSEITIAQSGTELTTNFSSNIQWFKDDELIPGATNPVYSVIETGEYFVRYTSEECLLESKKIELAVTGLIDEVADQITIYPNPTSGLLKIKIPQNQKSQIQIYSLEGKVIYSAEAKTETDILNIRWLESGFYILKVINKEGSTSFKLIKR